MTSPFHWQTTLDSGVMLGFTGRAFGSLAAKPHESGVVVHPRQKLADWTVINGFQPAHFMHQTHSCQVLNHSETNALPEGGFDGHYSSTADASLGVLVADCLPILFHGIGHHGQPVIAAVHAGRVGLLGGILQSAAEKFYPHLIPGTHPIAVIGPAICGSCYEVPEEIRAAAEQQLPRTGIASTTSWNTPALDLPTTAEAILMKQGFDVVKTGLCTLEDQNYFSYRGGDLTDRNAGIALVPQR